MTVKELFVTLGVTKDERSFQNAEASIKTLAGTAAKLLGALGIAMSLRSMNQLAEQFNSINDSIRDATRDMGDQLDIQRQIMDAANDTKVSYSSMAKNVTQLIKMNEKLFTDVNTAANFATLFSKDLKAAGKSEGEITSAVSMLNRTLARGSLDAMSYERMLRSYPEVINTIAAGMGVTKDELKKLASSGKITSEAIVNAYSKATDTIQSRFDELDYSISDAMLHIRNEWGLFCDQLWEGSDITNGLGKTMVEVFDKILAVLKKVQPYAERSIKWLLNKVKSALDFFDKVSNYVSAFVKKVGGLENAMRMLGIAITTALVASKWKKVLAFAQSITKLLNPTVLGIIAIILVVEDLYQFLQGNESLIGTMLEKNGKDLDKVRENITNTFNNIKEIATALWNGFKTTALPILREVFKVLGKIIEKVSLVFAKLFDLLGGDVRLDNWEKLGRVLGYLIPIVLGLIAAIKVVTAVFALVTSPITWVIVGITALIAVIVLLVQHWDEVKAAVQLVWDKIVEVFANIGEWFQEHVIDPIAEKIEWFKDLPERAKEWGRDMLDGFVQGIKDKVESVKDAVKGVGETISDFLHFSEPDEGPLSNYHTWMPDMMKGLAAGISDNQSIVLEGVKKLAGGISTLMQDATASANMLGNKRSNVTQNVTFNNSYSGSNADVIKNIANTTKASAVDATTLMARSLAIARG